MATPFFTIRLSREIQDKLAEVAKIYGAPNTTSFVRDLFEGVFDSEKGAKFTARLQEALTGQLSIEFKQELDRRVAEARGVQKPPRKRKRRSVDKKGRGGR